MFTASGGSSGCAWRSSSRAQSWTSTWRSETDGTRVLIQRGCVEIVEHDLDTLVRGFLKGGRHAPAVLRPPVDDGDPGLARDMVEATALGAGEGRRQARRLLVRNDGRRLAAHLGGGTAAVVLQVRSAEEEGAGAATADDPRLLAVAGRDPLGRAFGLQMHPGHRRRGSRRRSGDHDHDPAQRPAPQGSVHLVPSFAGGSSPSRLIVTG